MRDDRIQTNLWWRLAASYGWSIAVREMEASPRWSPSTKARLGVVAGVAISVPVTLGIGLPYVYWLLTGRGPWQRYGFSSAVVVNPFRHRIPADIRAALAELGTERAGQYTRSSGERAPYVPLWSDR